MRGATTADRDSAADYTISFSGGSQVVTVDQDKSSGRWVPLGTFPFDAGLNSTHSVQHPSDLTPSRQVT